MKKVSIAVLALAFGFAWSTQAADPEAGKGLTAEQQKERNALIQKYDANKDGVLDKAEAKGISKQDKKALARLGGVGTTKKDEGKVRDGDKGKDGDKVKDGDKPKDGPRNGDQPKGDKGKGKK